MKNIYTMMPPNNRVVAVFDFSKTTSQEAITSMVRLNLNWIKIDLKKEYDYEVLIELLELQQKYNFVIHLQIHSNLEYPIEVANYVVNFLKRRRYTYLVLSSFDYTLISKLQESLPFIACIWSVNKIDDFTFLIAQQKKFHAIYYNKKTITRALLKEANAAHIPIIMPVINKKGKQHLLELGVDAILCKNVRLTSET